MTQRTDKENEKIYYFGVSSSIGKWFANKHKNGCRVFSTGLPECGCGCDCGIGHLTQEHLAEFKEKEICDCYEHGYGVIPTVDGICQRCKKPLLK